MWKHIMHKKNKFYQKQTHRKLNWEVNIIACIEVKIGKRIEEKYVKCTLTVSKQTKSF
jgi:hypothetical protein